MISLGPFTLEQPVGRGGMAEVWAGQHSNGTPVAVKVLTEEQARRALFVQAFQHEVRAVAGLHHPAIVTVYDYGLIPPETSEQSKGHLAAGSPYLVMELVNGGTLHRHAGRLPWPTLRKYLLELLEALAHAHARGVIHRDIKPANVLLREGGTGVVLTDFGLAHALDDENAGAKEERAMGTVPFMAPEQYLCAWRDYGPWTDMYALGAVVFTLVSDLLPFHCNDFAAWRYAHFYHPVPALRPKMEVPKGLEFWIQKMMAKQPYCRYQHAADAAADLRHLKLEEATVRDMAGVPLLREQEPTLIHPKEEPGRTFGEFAESDVGSIPPEVLRSAQGSAPLQSDPNHTMGGVEEGQKVEDPLLPFRQKWMRLQEKVLSPEQRTLFAKEKLLPDTWMTAAPQTSSHLLGAGLGIYGLRTIPLVDRTNERSTLWDTLKETHRERRAKMVVLKGLAGYGKSRLAEWLAVRAQEVGAAHILKALHSPHAGARDGLEPMLARFLRCVGLSRAEIHLRCQILLRAMSINIPEQDIALTELLSPREHSKNSDSNEPVIRFHNPTERYAVIRYYLEGLAQEKPVLLWLDDIQWGVDTLAFCEYLLDCQDLSPAPILVVATVQNESLSECNVERELLDRLLQHDDVNALEIEPLPSRYRSELVCELLGLEKNLARRVESRTGGNPLFAVQLVGDWVTRGLLQLGEEGFRLQKDAYVSLPDTLHDVWAQRVSRVLEGSSPSARKSLELAALLGQDVDSEEWRLACEKAFVPSSFELVEALLRHQLARSHEEGLGVGWSFVHGMLRECLSRQCQEAGRWMRFHRLCAEVMAESSKHGTLEREGHHLLASGSTSAAIGVYLQAAKEYITTGDYLRVLRVLDECEELLETEQAPQKDSRWGKIWVLRSRTVQLQGDYDSGAVWASKAEEAARLHHWPRILAEALLRGGNSSRIQGKADTLPKLFEAAQLWTEQKDFEKLGHTLINQGYFLMKKGEFREARVTAHRALDSFREAGASYMEAICYTLISDLEQHTGSLENAKREIAHAQELYRQSGSRWGLACSLNSLGEIARMQQKLDDAEQFYRDALLQYQAIGSGSAIFPQFNLGQLLIMRQCYSEAETVLSETLQNVRKQGRRALSASIYLCFAAIAAARQDWPGWEGNFFQVSALLESTNYVDVDIPMMATIAGNLACSHSDFRRACQAYTLAAQQWEALNQPEKAQEIQAIIHKMSAEIS